MAIGSGTHWEAALLGSDKAQGGLCDDVPVQVQTARFRNHVFFDFIDAADDDGFTLTQLVAGGASAIQPLASSGVNRIVCGAVDAQGTGSYQLTVSAWTPSLTATADGTRRTIACAARFSHSDFSIANWFFGLAASDTTLMGTTGLMLTTGADDFVGFHHVVDAVAQGGITGPDGNDVRLVSAGGGVANYQATLLSAANQPVPAPADASIDSVFVEYGIRILGTQDVEWYRNGVLRHRRRMSNALANPLRISFAMVSNGTDNSFDVDYVWASGAR